MKGEEIVMRKLAGTMPKAEALMSKLEDMNEEAHQAVIDIWVEADRLEADDLLDEAEAKREEASEAQISYFTEIFDNVLSSDEHEAVWHFVETDPDGFGEQFFQWYED